VPVAADQGRGPTVDADQEKWQVELARYVMQKVTMADAQEEQRRKTDRVGANLFYGRHWNVAVPRQRSALTANMVKALIEHKIAIMTKQEPLPVIVAGEAGDATSAQLMRRVMMRWWRDDGMQMKLRRSLRIANSTRTNALKASWDPSRRGGAGDVTVDIIPGWRLILDDRANFIDGMEFIGHREMMRRSLAAQYYPESSDLIFGPIENTQEGRRNGAASAQLPSSPIGSSFRSSVGGSMNFGTIVNGKPVISAFSNQPAGYAPKDDQVQIIELFLKDDSMYETDEKEYDDNGMVRMEIERDEDGVPQFDELPSVYTNIDGQPVDLPNYKLRQREKTRKAMKRVYPYWRRTTLMLPDKLILDDMAWDGPAPYALVSDGDALEGPHVKGCALDLEDMQVTLNVSLSLMMDNLRLSSMRPVLAGQASNIEGASLLVSPGQVVRVGNVDQIKPFEFPQLSQSWFEWANFLIALMERIVGAQGVMQGQAAGRVDSASGYDTLAEIGGSRIVESAQRMEVAIQDIMRVVGWFAQKYYTEKHAIAVEDNEGNPTYERVSGPFLFGTFDYMIQTGSTLAWSESAVRGRLMQELQAGIIDKVAYWQRTNTPDYQLIRDRILKQNPILSGAAASPPPRTRTAPKPKSSSTPKG